MMSMPIKLAVSFAIIAIMVPTVMTAADDVQRDLEHSDLDRESGRLADLAGRLHHSSIGTVHSITVDLPPNMALLVGGEGADRYVIRLISDGEIVGRTYMENPSVSISCEETYLHGGDTVMLRCEAIDGEVCAW